MPILTVEHRWGKIRFSMGKVGHRHWIYVGDCTIASGGLFKLFVVGKTILRGEPTHYQVNISPIEARVIKMIFTTSYERKRSFWSKINNKELTKEEALSKLSKELPTLALMKKLDTRRTSYA